MSDPEMYHEQLKLRETLEKLNSEKPNFLNPHQWQRAEKPKPNDLCPCESGKKYKKCCYSKEI